MEVIPAEADFHGRWDVPRENILICLGTAHLSEIAAREFDMGGIDLCPLAHGLFDRTALRLGPLIREEMGCEAERSALYRDSLVTALAVQILRARSPVSGLAVQPVFQGGLPPQVRRAIQEFVCESLDREITLESSPRPRSGKRITDMTVGRGAADTIRRVQTPCGGAAGRAGPGYECMRLRRSRAAMVPRCLLPVRSPPHAGRVAASDLRRCGPRIRTRRAPRHHFGFLRRACRGANCGNRK